MASFEVELGDGDLAGQVAAMLNAYNRLRARHDKDTVLRSEAKYIVSMHGNRVEGCAAVLREYPTLSRIMHVCVVHEQRQSGIGKRLVARACEVATTENVYASIRNDNVASLALFEKLGFVEVRVGVDYGRVLIYGRRAK